MHNCTDLYFGYCSGVTN